MLTPLKLARLVQWKGRLGKSSAILAIDVTNQQIGLALAYYRQQALDHEETNSDLGDNNDSATATTLITPLPPIPYMSNKPYHPSYAFLHRPNLKDQGTKSLQRKERTLEIAYQLAQLAKQREVNGILIRWPGDLGGFVCSSTASPEEVFKNREEDQMLLSLETDGTIDSINNRQADTVQKHAADGSMGYLRGRILYVLDCCCDSNGHNESKVSPEPLLMEGLRPFALWDTSDSEHEWVLNQKHQATPSTANRVDKYGNSFTETDSWGRSAIYGNRPPKPTQGQFRYSSKQLHYGYRVSSEFGSSSSSAVETPSRSPLQDNFDSFQDNESYLKQFEGSLAAIHALYEFAGTHLNGRITLPSWVSEKEIDHHGHSRLTNNAVNSVRDTGHTESTKTDSSTSRKGTLVTLAKMPVRRRRRGADRRS